jgi:hypothetical protein
MGFWVEARQYDREIKEYRYYPVREYYYYSKRDAVRMYRQEMGIVGKHVELTVEIVTR